MTAKEYLNQAFHLDQRINSKLDMMATLKEMSTKTTSIMQDDVVSHTRNVHSMEDAIAKIQSNTRRYMRKQLTWSNQCGHRSADRQEAGDHAHDLRGGKSGIPDTAGAQIHLLSQLGGDR